MQIKWILPADVFSVYVLLDLQVLKHCLVLMTVWSSVSVHPNSNHALREWLEKQWLLEQQVQARGRAYGE